ncbi:MAG: hypothetical protein KIY10_03625 [Thermoplasmata archaeon]|jgi:uncharacterized protein with GYD domain|nr:hypothetical protein [Candidatus Sysuiplasma jiujiangense]MBX8641646.1 hypothetical protein [Candidatus Sysuiplasma jiujiangense]
MDVIMLIKAKRLPTKKESEEAQRISDEAVRKGAKIEIYRTYGTYDTIAIVKGQDEGEETYLRYLHTVKEWADVQTQVVIDSELYSRVSKDYIK